VRLESVEISDLAPSEVWSDHGTAALPRCAVCVEDAMSKDWAKDASSPQSQRVVLEIGRQDGFENLGLSGLNGCRVSVESSAPSLAKVHGASYTVFEASGTAR
jgi:hypothetical protein